MRKERAAKRAERMEASASVFRAGSDQPRHEDPPARSYPAKKDKRRWCGGHVGREHKIVVGRKKAWASMLLGPRSRLPVIRYCASCGKELDIHFWWEKKPKPEWVTRFLEAEAAGSDTISA